MSSGRRNHETALRVAERRQRENQAMRLIAVVPRLRSLQIAFSASDGGAVSNVDHVRHVVVGRAPALFEQRCANPSCKGGEHDLTHEILAGLTRGEIRIQGEDRCLSPLANGTCPWVLAYVATATYEPESPIPNGGGRQSGP